MDLKRSSTPYAVLATVTAIVCLAVVRLPEAFVASFARNRPLSSAQAGWAYRLLVLAALGQAAYCGFVVLRIDRVKAERAKDERLSALTLNEVLAAVDRNAVFMSGLTLIYGLASFGVTAQRGGFWLFPLILIAQAAWYYRQGSEIANWLRFQPETEDEAEERGTWTREPPDYCPPIARGLTAPTAQ